MDPAWNDQTLAADHSVDGPAVDGLAWRMGEFAQQLHQERTEADVLARLAQTAVDMIPGAQEASISSMVRQAMEPQCASGPLARRADELQVRLGQGPCFYVVADDPVVHVPDVATEARWPEFIARARDVGVGSMLSIRLFVASDVLGTLNLYSTDTDAFDEDAVDVGVLVAAHAAVVLVETRESDQLRDAASSRMSSGRPRGS
ncbi:GAF domain-containing protein [Arthrobacter sp. JSM 101049]|uniref:GAF domain-containing protein n=1 Tax=Arthrobacter sp. JSM 101049 TaxID=929097 RepID=UPI003566A089